MGHEPERKFLILNDDWKKGVTGQVEIAQGYLSKDKDRTVRIRFAGDEAFLTVKGAPPPGSIDAPEFEYKIPREDAEDMMKLALPGTVEKTRYYVPYKGHIWEVDVFHGKNEGLVVAEIEFKNGEVPFEKPPWLGEEVTFNPCYKNSSLSEHPYSEWKKDTPAKAACLKP